MELPRCAPTLRRSACGTWLGCVAVLALKDLPTREQDRLSIAAILERGDPRDCLLTRHPGGLGGLPFGATIGTSSPRRAAQLAVARPDLIAHPIRGNVDTRLRRL